MKTNNMGKLLGVALVVAIICTGLFYMMFAMKANSETGTQMVVAAKALRAGTVLKAEDLKTINWPVPQLPPGAHRSPQEVIGSTVFDPMAPEEPVLNARLATSESAGESGIPVGMRAVSIHLTDSTGVLALLHSGQKVDVQVVVGDSTYLGWQVRMVDLQASSSSVYHFGEAAVGQNYVRQRPYDKLCQSNSATSQIHTRLDRD